MSGSHFMQHASHLLSSPSLNCKPQGVGLKRLQEVAQLCLAWHIRVMGDEGLRPWLICHGAEAVCLSIGPVQARHCSFPPELWCPAVFYLLTHITFILFVINEYVFGPVLIVDVSFAVNVNFIDVLCTCRDECCRTAADCFRLYSGSEKRHIPLDSSGRSCSWQACRSCETSAWQRCWLHIQSWGKLKN